MPCSGAGPDTAAGVKNSVAPAACSRRVRARRPGGRRASAVAGEMAGLSPHRGQASGRSRVENHQGVEQTGGASLLGLEAKNSDSPSTRREPAPGLVETPAHTGAHLLGHRCRDHVHRKRGKPSVRCSSRRNSRQARHGTRYRTPHRQGWTDHPLRRGCTPGLSRGSQETPRGMRRLGRQGRSRQCNTLAPKTQPGGGRCKHVTGVIGAY